MFDPVTITIIAATAMGGYQAYSAQEAATDQKHAVNKASRANSTALDAQAQDEAERIRFQSERLQKTQRATAAKAGLVVGQGTALDLTAETDALAKKDIATMFRNVGSQKTSMKIEAGNVKRVAQDNANAALVSAIGGTVNTALGSAGDMRKTDNALMEGKMQNRNYIQQSPYSLDMGEGFGQFKLGKLGY